MTATTITDQLRARMQMRQDIPAPKECRRIRKAAGLTLRDVAKALGTTHGAVGFWERGERKPRPEMRARYLEALDAMRQAAQ